MFVKNVLKDKKYEKLLEIFTKAYERAAVGKGKERHANGEAFENQLICSIPERVGIGFNLGQALKKAYEQERINPEQAVNELLDAINYLAAAIIVIENRK
jgi:hypothetical protein